MARGRNVAVEMVVGGRRREAKMEERRLQFCYPDLMWNGDRTIMTPFVAHPPTRNSVDYLQFFLVPPSRPPTHRIPQVTSDTHPDCNGGRPGSAQLPLPGTGRVSESGPPLDACSDHLAQAYTAGVATGSYLICDSETPEASVKYDPQTFSLKFIFRLMV